MDSNLLSFTHPLLSGISYLRHGFFGKQGGVSSGIYRSLNCGLGSNDKLENVVENRKRVARSLHSFAPLVTAHQVHSAKCIMLDSAEALSKTYQVDAQITELPHVVLGVLTADCAPILVADRTHKRIATIHAGWKGAFGGVVKQTISMMVERGSNQEDLVAVVGPCIQQSSYEVDSAFYQRFLKADSVYESFFELSPLKPNHYLFNLPAYVLECIKAEGVMNCDLLDEDTYTQDSHFFSYRRATHRREEDYGRQVSAIVISK